jgi:hypothetical protein
MEPQHPFVNGQFLQPICSSPQTHNQVFYDPFQCVFPSVPRSSNHSPPFSSFIQFLTRQTPCATFHDMTTLRGQEILCIHPSTQTPTLQKYLASTIRSRSLHYSPFCTLKYLLQIPPSKLLRTNKLIQVLHVYLLRNTQDVQ